MSESENVTVFEEEPSEKSYEATIADLRAEVAQLGVDNARLRIGMDPTVVIALSALDRQEKER